MNSNCYNLLYLRNLQEQVKKAFCYPIVRTNCSCDLKNSWPSASNFKKISTSLEWFFLTVGQNNFDKKIPFKISFVLKRSSNWIFAFLEFYEISCQILFSKMHSLFQCLESVYLWNKLGTHRFLFWRKRKHCVKDNSRFGGRKMRKSASKVEKPKCSYIKCLKQGYINRYNLIHCTMADFFYDTLQRRTLTIACL